MGKDVNQYVLTLLETYPETSKRIELMRYELYSSMVVSPQEMIEVMSFSKKDAEANAKYPHTVPEIALCYKEIAQRLNHEVAESVMETYVSMIRERDRLHHRISLLAPRRRSYRNITSTGIAGVISQKTWAFRFGRLIPHGSKRSMRLYRCIRSPELFLTARKNKAPACISQDLRTRKEKHLLK